MYNKKVLIDALKNLGSAKAPAVKKDVVVGSNDPMSAFTMKKGGSTVDKKLSVKKSNIQGKGLFIDQPVKKGEIIGLAHVNNQATPVVGKYHNHSEENPTAVNVQQGNKRYLVAAADLMPGTEITTNYRLQPDLEQPEDFQDGGQMTPQKDGYRTYSPFQNLPYIDVESDTIDTDNIVTDLRLVGNNGIIKNVQKNSGLHKIPGASVIREIPLKKKQLGGLTRFIPQAGKMLALPPITNTIANTAPSILNSFNSISQKLPTNLLDQGTRDLLNYPILDITAGESNFRIPDVTKYLGDFEFKPFSDGWLARQSMMNMVAGPQWVPSKEDFYTDSEIADLVNKEIEYRNAWNAFEEMNPEEPGMQIMRALSGDTSRDELFSNLFPNSYMPNFRSKFLSPEQSAFLNNAGLSNPTFTNKGLLNKSSLKSLTKGEDVLPRTYKELLDESKADTWLKTADPKMVVMEMRGGLGLKMEDINNATPEQLEKWRQQVVTKMYKQAVERWKKDIGTPLKGSDAYNQFFNRTGSRNQFGGSIDELPLQKKGGSAPKMPKKKNSKAYSRSLEATNRLLAQHPFFAQPKSRKNKIYDPNAKYYQDGGSLPPDVNIVYLPEGERSYYDPISDTIYLNPNASPEELDHEMVHAYQNRNDGFRSDPYSPKLRPSTAATDEQAATYFNRKGDDVDRYLNNLGTIVPEFGGHTWGSDLDRFIPDQVKYDKVIDPLMYYDANTLEGEAEMLAQRYGRPPLGFKQNGGATTPEAWEQEIRAVESQIGNPKNWTLEDYNLLQDKLNAYKNWRETTPEGQAVKDYHKKANEYIVSVPEHLNGAPYNTSGPRYIEESLEEYPVGSEPNVYGNEPEDYQNFLDYNKTAPENRRGYEDYRYGDPNSYDHYGMWDALGKPKDFEEALKMNPDWQPDPYDGYYHGFSVNPNTGVFLKSGKPGFKPGDTTWMEIAGHYLSPRADMDTPVFDPELGRFKYVPNEEYIETELTPEEIEEYRKGGYIIEDISVPKLNQAKSGGLVKAQKGLITAGTNALRAIKPIQTAAAATLPELTSLVKLSDFTKNFKPESLNIKFPLVLEGNSGIIQLAPNTKNLEDNLWHFGATMTNPIEAGKAMMMANQLFPFPNPSILEPHSLSLDSYNMLLNMGRRNDWDMAYENDVPLNWLHEHSDLFKGLKTPSSMSIGLGIDDATADEMVFRLNNYLTSKGLKDQAYRIGPPGVSNMNRIYVPNYKLTRRYQGGGPTASIGDAPMIEETPSPTTVPATINASDYFTNWYNQRQLPFEEIGNKSYEKKLKKFLPQYNPESPLIDELQRSIPYEYMDVIADNPNVMGELVYDENGNPQKILLKENLKENPQELNATIAHEERTRLWDKYRDEILPAEQIIIQPNIKSFEEGWGDLKGEEKKAAEEYYDYLTDPNQDNIQSAIFEVRQKKGLKPDQVITDDDILNWKKEAESSGALDRNSPNFDNALYNLFKIAKDNVALKDLFNYIASNTTEDTEEGLQYAQYGGFTGYELGDQVDEATMKKLKKLGYTFEKI